MNRERPRTAFMERDRPMTPSTRYSIGSAPTEKPVPDTDGLVALPRLPQLGVERAGNNQVRPWDSSVALWQAESAVNRLWRGRFKDEAARVHHAARRRCGSMAARGKGAAAIVAGDRVPGQRIA